MLLIVLLLLERALIRRNLNGFQRSVRSADFNKARLAGNKGTGRRYAGARQRDDKQNRNDGPVVTHRGIKGSFEEKSTGKREAG